MSTVPTVWNGVLPRVGIRPTIDGRLGGVRESLEDQTMNLAKRVAELVSSELRYPNGVPAIDIMSDWVQLDCSLRQGRSKVLRIFLAGM